MNTQKNCPLCTKKINDDSPVCPYCGYEFNSIVPTQKNPVFPPGASYKQTNQTSKPVSGFIDVGKITIFFFAFVGAILSVAGDIATESFLTVTVDFLIIFLFLLVVLYIVYWIISTFYTKSCEWGFLLWSAGIFGFIIFFAIILAFVFGMLDSGTSYGTDSPASYVVASLPPTVAPPQKFVTDATPYITVDPYATPTRNSVYSSMPGITGTIIKGGYLSGGDGELTIDNSNGGSDAVAVLTYRGQKEALIGVFIQKSTSYTINNIRDGNYDLYILSGSNWNSNTKKFDGYSHYSKFDDSFPFTTTDIKYTTWEVTLYKVIDGNAEETVLSEDQFPEL